MLYTNPILSGFYPDPSVCFAKGKYYMVCSTFQYFPGVPIFESDDLVNWKQIGHCLTRKNQVTLDKINSSGGVFAPTIRFNDNIFYMTTTNDTTRQNFYVWTSDIYGEWSDPIYIDQGGIDPSLYFEDGRSYFMSNGEDDMGVPGIVQCEINIQTGEKLSPSKTIWQGTGGRFLESPHLYKIGDGYYLMAAEGGTEYGHMITYARGNDIFGPFEAYSGNPVLTNRNLGGFTIQGVGHGDLIQAPDGSYYILHLGFRQTGMWSTYHHLGREVFISPVTFDENGWFTAGENGTTREKIELPHVTVPQQKKSSYTFENTDWNIDWCYLRHPDFGSYHLAEKEATLYGTSITLQEADSPTFIGLRQKEFDMELECTVSIDNGEAGITLYMDESHHYDVAIRKNEEGYEVIERLCVGTIKSVENRIPLKAAGDAATAVLKIRSDSQVYRFSFAGEKKDEELGYALSRYLSSEVAGGFTGVVIGLYAVCNNKNKAHFSDFSVAYKMPDTK